MFQLLAIEPDPRQARILRRTIDQYVDGNLVLVKNKDEAISAIETQAPDLILLTALLSPRDEDDLVQHLRLLPEANHLQTLTLPQLSSPSQAGNGHEPEKRGFFSSLRRKPRVEEPPVGCDPQVFAEEIVGYLERARDIKAERSGWSSIGSVDLEESRPRPEFDFERPRTAPNVAMGGQSQQSELSLSPGEETSTATPTSAAVGSTIDDDDGVDHGVVGDGQENTISTVLPGVDPVTEPWLGGSAHASFDTESSTLLDTDLESEADALVARLRAGLDRSASPSPDDEGQVPLALHGLERGTGDQGSLPDDLATTSQHETTLRPEPIEPERPSVEAHDDPPLERWSFDAAEDSGPSAPEPPSAAPAASSAPSESTVHAATGGLEKPPHEEALGERESTPTPEDGGTGVSRTLGAGTRGAGVWLEREGSDDSVDAGYESVIQAREALDDEPTEPATELEAPAPPPAAAGSILGLSAAGGPSLGAAGEPDGGALDPGQPPAIESATPSDLDAEKAGPDGRQRRWIGALNQAFNRVATVVGGKPRPDAPLDSFDTDDQDEATDTAPREAADGATAVLPDRSETPPAGEAGPLEASGSETGRDPGVEADPSDEILGTPARDPLLASAPGIDQPADLATSDASVVEPPTVAPPDAETDVNRDLSERGTTSVLDRAELANEATQPLTLGDQSDVTVVGADEIVIVVAEETTPEAEGASLVPDQASSSAGSDEAFAGEDGPLDASDLDRVVGAGSELTDQTASALATDRPAAPEASVPPADPTPPDGSVLDAAEAEVAPRDAPDTDVERSVGGPQDVTVLRTDEIVIEGAEETTPDAKAASLGPDQASSSAGADETSAGEDGPLDASDLDRVVGAGSELTDQTASALATDRPAAPEASVPPADPTPTDAGVVAAPAVEVAPLDAADTDVERPVGGPSDLTVLGADEIVIEVAEETTPDTEAASLGPDQASSSAGADETSAGEDGPLDASDLDRVVGAGSEHLDQTASALATDRPAAPEASVPPADPTPTDVGVVAAPAVEVAPLDAADTDVERPVGGPSDLTGVGADEIVVEVAEETTPDAETGSLASDPEPPGSGSDETPPSEAAPLDASDLDRVVGAGSELTDQTASALATDRPAAPEASVPPADPTPTDVGVVDAPAVEVAPLDAADTDLEGSVGGPSDLTALGADEIVIEVAEETTPDTEAASPEPDAAAPSVGSDEMPASEAVPLDSPDLDRVVGAGSELTDQTASALATDRPAAPEASVPPADPTPTDAGVVDAPAVEVAPLDAADTDLEGPVDRLSDGTVRGGDEIVVEVADSTTPGPEAARPEPDPASPIVGSDETPAGEAVPLDASELDRALGAETAPPDDIASAFATDRSAEPEESVPAADPTALGARATEPASSTGDEPGAPAASPPAPPRGPSGPESDASPSSTSADQLWLSKTIDSLKLDLKQLRDQQANRPEPHQTGEDQRARRGPTGRPTTRSTPSGAPIAIWARRQHDPAISTRSAAGRETDLFRQLMQGRGIPLHVASVEYARGCRIQRVRVAPDRAAAEVTADEPLVVLSKKKLVSSRQGRRSPSDFSDFVDRP